MRKATCHPDRPDVGGGDCADCLLEGIEDWASHMDETPGRVCSRCGESRPVQEFHKNRSVCRACIRKSKYGLTPAGYGILMEELGGRCSICAVPKEWAGLVVDHDHQTDVVRGLLCPRCNLALGLLDDDEDRLRRAAEYLASPPTSESVDFNMGGCGCFPGQPHSTMGQVEIRRRWRE